MKLQLFLPVSILVSVAMVGVMKIRKKEHEKVDRRNRFEAIKLRVTHDVLGEYQSEKAQTQDQLDKAKKDMKALEDEVKNKFQVEDTKKKAELDTCQAGQVMTELSTECLTSDSHVKVEFVEFTLHGCKNVAWA